MIAAPPSPSLPQLLVFPSVAVLVAAILTVMPTAIPTSLQIVGLLVVVVVLGVPHGALDPWIAELAGLVSTRRTLIIFNFVYVALAAAVVVIWSLVPGPALLGFLVVSAWHFSGDWAGDWAGDWDAPLRQVAQVVMRSVSGGLLLLLPIGVHSGEVAEIFALLSGEAGGDLTQWLSLPAPVLVAGTLVVIAVAALLHKWWTAVQFAALLALAISAPPLVYFAIYFCLLHSPTHLIGYFQMAGPALRGRLVRMTLIYSVGSLAVGLPVVWLWSGTGADSLLARLIFIGLAALTVPHMVLLAVASRCEMTHKIDDHDAAHHSASA
jgi:Brp/Blh family beta-carotene 15,15'-monooxygenase